MRGKARGSSVPLPPNRNDEKDGLLLSDGRDKKVDTVGEVCTSVFVPNGAETTMGDCRGDSCGCSGKCIVIKGGSSGVVASARSLSRSILSSAVIRVPSETRLFVSSGFGKYEIGCGVAAAELSKERPRD